MRIPDIKINIDANKAELAIGLLGAPFGALVVLPFAGMIAVRIGVRMTLLIGLPLNILALMMIGLASSVTMLFLLGCLTGLFLALTEVGINISASNAEKRLGRLIMNRAHGFWTFGLLSGSGLGVLMASLGMSVFASMATLALLVVPGAVFCAHHFACEPEERSQGSDPHGPFRFTIPLTLLGVFLFASALTEGAAAEWSALYLHEVLDWTTSASGWGVILLASSLTLMRWCGDWLAMRLGPLLLARVLCVVAIVGLLLVATPLPAAAALLGFALIGIGIGLGFPLSMSAAGRLRGDSSKNIAFMSFMSIGAFLAGPPMMGFIAEATDLRWSFAALIPLVFFALLSTAALHKRHAYHL